MGLLNKIREGDFTGLNRALGKGKHSLPSGVSVNDDDEDRGIAGGPQAGKKKSRWSRGGGDAAGGGMVDDEDTSPLHVGIRGATVFFLLVNLFIYVAIAIFQKNNKVGPSGLTGLALFVIIEALLHAIVFLAVPQIYERTDKLKGVARAIRLTRVQFIVFGTQTALVFILTLTATISAYTAGCRDSSKDPHASDTDYISKLGGFCRNKRAAAAFWWFSFLGFAASLGLTFKAWYSIRKLGPRHPTFDPPSANNAADDGFDEPDDENDPDEGGEPVYEAVGSRPSNAGGYYGDRPAFDDAQSAAPPGYGAPQRQTTSVQYRPPAPQMSAAPRYADPFDEIRAQIYQSGRS